MVQAPLGLGMLAVAGAPEGRKGFLLKMYLPLGEVGCLGWKQKGFPACEK